MSARRLMLPFAGLALFGVIVAWLAVRTTVTGAAAEIAPGEAVAILAGCRGATFDLTLCPESRYVLVVGSLGEASETYDVTLHSEPVSKAAPIRGERLEKMEIRRSGSPADRGFGRGKLRRPAAAASRILPQARTAGFLGAVAAWKHSPTATPGLSIPTERGTRSFFIHVTEGELDDSKQYARVVGRQVREGDRVRVFLDQQQRASDLAPDLLDEIVNFCDRTIIPRVADSLGEFRDVDGDGKFAVLLTPWLDRLQGGRTSLGGFVRATDFRAGVAAPFGNCCDMLYLNSNTRPGEHLQTLLSHEYTHAVCCSIRAPSERCRRGLADEEDWLNEAIAHVAERWTGAGWSNLDYRVSRYLTAPEEFPLVVPDYYRAGLWRNHGCRGATYLFLQWFVDTFGEDALARMIRNPQTGRKNLEQISGMPFDKLFRQWTVEMLSPHAPGAPVAEPHPRGCNRRDLDIRGRAGEFVLAGPRTAEWDVPGEPCRLRVRGTAARFVALRPTRGDQPRQIRIAAAGGARLQVTLVRLPDALPFVEVAAGWRGASRNEDSADAAAGLTLSVQTSDEDVSVEAIAVEQNDGEIKRCDCFNAAALEKARCRDEATEAAASRFELPAATIKPAETRTTVKVVARDRRGRYVVGWATVAPFAPVAGPLQVATVGIEGRGVGAQSPDPER